MNNKQLVEMNTLPTETESILNIREMYLQLQELTLDSINHYKMQPLIKLPVSLNQAMEKEILLNHLLGVKTQQVFFTFY